MKVGHWTCGLALGIPLIAAVVAHQDESQVLDAAGLKTMVSGLGYEVKDLVTEVGKEKYQFTVKTGKFNVPIGVEIAPSKNYIWLTANLGKVTSKTKYEELLRSNALIQPSQFYVSSAGYLMIAIPVENHGVTPAWMRKSVDKLAKDLSDQATVWNTGE
jgi:hypothetical protein